VARGNRRWGRILLILGLVVIVLLIAADRIGVLVAENTVAKQARTQLASENITTSANPDVTISGFPFLTQVAAGHYSKINIVVPNPTSKGIRLDSLNVTATDVTAPTSSVISGNGQIEAGKVVGTAQINWASFEEMVDLSGLSQYGIDPSSLHITSTDGGVVTVSAPVKIAGQSFTAIATGSVSIVNDLLHIKITKITASQSGLPSLIVAQLQSLESQLNFDARIPALPYHLVVDAVNTNATGVAIRASATNVILGS
jgi:LmeA-like phospholipid-binding